MADLGRPLEMTFEITKIDEAKRYVGGYATTETLDKQGDIIDYDGSVRAFNAWPGNVREQHDAKKAIGKAVEIRPDPKTRRIWVGTFISRSRDGEDTWTKVKEHILKGFSIKGQVTDSKPEVVVKSGARTTANRVTDYRLDELSLVDNPACPDALVHLVKAAGGTLYATEVLKRDSDPDVGGGTDRDELRRRITAIARRKGPEFVAALPDACKEGEEKKMANPVNSAIAALSKLVDASKIGNVEAAYLAFAQAVTKSLNGHALARVEKAIVEAANSLDDIKDTAPVRESGREEEAEEHAEEDEAEEHAEEEGAECAICGKPKDECSCDGKDPDKPGVVSEGIIGDEKPTASEREANSEKAAGGKTTSLAKKVQKTNPLRKAVPAGLPWPGDGGAGGDKADDGEAPPEEEEPTSPGMDAQKIHDLACLLGAKCKPAEKPAEEKPKEEAPFPGVPAGDQNQMKGMGHAEIVRLVQETVNQAIEKVLGKSASGQQGSLEKIATRLAPLEKVGEQIGGLEKRLKALEDLPASTDNAPALRAVEKSLGSPADGGGRVAGLNGADDDTLSKLADKTSDPYLKQQIGMARAYLAMKGQG